MSTNRGRDEPRRQRLRTTEEPTAAIETGPSEVGRSQTEDGEPVDGQTKGSEVVPDGNPPALRSEHAARHPFLQVATPFHFSEMSFAEGKASFADYRLRVLIFDPDVADRDEIAEVIEEALEGQCRIDSVGEEQLGLDLLGQDVHDLYLIGFRRVEEALTLIRAGANCRGAIIALVESPEEEIRLRALEAGASECIARQTLSRAALGRFIRRAFVRQHNARRDKEQRALLDREVDRLNGLREASHRLAQRACHDIQSQLGVIKNYSSLLLSELKTSIDDEQTESFRTVMRRVDDVGNMVDQILDASQLASDLIGAQRDVVDVGGLVEELRQGLEQTASANEALLSLSIDAALPDAYCDRANIAHVIRSLVAYSCKAAGPGGKVELWSHYDPEQMSVRIGVTDYGSGASNEGKPEGGPVSQPLRSADDEDLALHVVKEAVRINLGELSVAAQLGGGRTFAFTLPVVDLDRILWAHLGVLQSGRQTKSALSVTLAAVPPPWSDLHPREIVQFLCGELRACDLVVPVGQGVWALCISSNAGDIAEIVRRLARAFAATHRSHHDRPLPVLSQWIVGTWPLSARPEDVAAAVRRALSTGFGLHSEPGLLAERLDAGLIADGGAGSVPTYEEGPPVSPLREVWSSPNAKRAANFGRGVAKRPGPPASRPPDEAEVTERPDHLDTHLRNLTKTNAKVLIVDDDPSILRTLSENCAKLGLEVQAAENGLQAILRAKRDPPRLIILERQLPEADAFRVCESLLDPKRPLDMIILTANPDTETLDRCKALGAYCVPKDPDTWNKLLSILVEVLEIEGDVLASLAPPKKSRTDPLSFERVRNKVLIVDDDLDLVKALARRLQKCGANTFTAADGISGYRIAVKERPDVIISDHVMPNGSGHYMNWRLKNTEATRHIPVIVITGHTPGGDGNTLAKPEGRSHDGPVKYFHKPLDVDALLTETSHYCAIHYNPFDGPQ